MQPTILVPIANGTEEIEAVTIIDLLRRAGALVTIAGENDNVICSRGIRINPDILMSEIEPTDEYDCIILPGGLAGVERLSQNSDLIEVLSNHRKQSKLVGAICSAPLILSQNGLLPRSISLTSHPDAESQLCSYKYSTQRVVHDLWLISSRGVGTTIEFCLALISVLFNQSTANSIAEQIVFTYPVSGTPSAIS
jgi:DJ-1 family protein